MTLAGSRGGRAARPLNPLTWLVLPALACLLATWLLAVPLQIFGVGLPEPVFAVVLAFAWPLVRPSLLAPFALLLLGLALDLFWGSAMGFWALSLLIGYAGVAATRPLISGQGYVVTWIWFVGVVVLVLGAAYVFTMLDARVRPSLWAVASQALVTALLYPVAGRLIDQFEEADVRFR
jgi:rod shape-determining protein MreD